MGYRKFRSNNRDGFRPEVTAAVAAEEFRGIPWNSLHGVELRRALVASQHSRCEKATAQGARVRHSVGSTNVCLEMHQFPLLENGIYMEPAVREFGCHGLIRSDSTTAVCSTRCSKSSLTTSSDKIFWYGLLSLSCDIH